MGLCELLTVVFVTLKLIGTITWSWWWVFAPMYPALVIYAFILALYGGVFVVAFNDIRKKG